MPINTIPNDKQIADPKTGLMTLVWQSLFSSIHDWLGSVGQSGTTAQRPVDGSRNPLYIGQQYFDTTLNRPIWVSSRNPTVWVKADGTVV